MFVLMTLASLGRSTVLLCGASRAKPGHIPMFFAGDGVWAHLYHNCGGESPSEKPWD